MSFINANLVGQRLGALGYDVGSTAPAASSGLSSIGSLFTGTDTASGLPVVLEFAIAGAAVWLLLTAFKGAQKTVRGVKRSFKQRTAKAKRKKELQQELADL